jgi:hypothetical protein
MRACERPLRIGRIGGRDAPLEALGQVLADAAPDGGIVAFLRNVDDHGHETAEPVGAHQRAYPGMLGEVEDVQREAEQDVLFDLEQLVPREGLEDLRERSPVEARRIELGTLQDPGDLAAKVRNLRDRTRIGRCGEQPDQRELAPEPAGGTEELRADVIEIGAPMDARFHACLRDE